MADEGEPQRVAFGPVPRTQKQQHNGGSYVSTTTCFNVLTEAHARLDPRYACVLFLYSLFISTVCPFFATKLSSFLYSLSLLPYLFPALVSYYIAFSPTPNNQFPFISLAFFISPSTVRILHSFLFLPHFLLPCPFLYLLRTMSP